MNGVAETLRAVGDLFVQIGPTNFILLFALGLLAWAIVKGRVAGTTAKEAVAEAVTPMTCMWGETDRKDLNEALRRLESIERDLAILKDRQR